MVQFEVKNEPVHIGVKDNPVTMSVQDTGVVKIAGSAAKIGVVTLLASAWVGDGNMYSQVVYIDGVTENSQVDLTPSAEQLGVFYEKSLALVAENEGGVVTVYAIGQKPENDYAVQVTISEVGE